MDNTLNILNPENVLKRGYTITSLNGRILKSSDQVKADDIIDTQFSDGTVRSKVVEKTKKQNERRQKLNRREVEKLKDIIS